MPHFRIVPDLVTGEVNVTTDTQFNHVDAEKVVLRKNVTARIFGSVKYVILGHGSCLYLHGTAARIENQGGEVFIY